MHPCHQHPGQETEGDWSPGLLVLFPHHYSLPLAPNEPSSWILTLQVNFAQLRTQIKSHYVFFSCSSSFVQNYACGFTQAAGCGCISSSGLLWILVFSKAAIPTHTPTRQDISADCSTSSPTLSVKTMGFYILTILVGYAVVFGCGLNLYLEDFFCFKQNLKKILGCISSVPLILASRKKETDGSWQSREKQNDTHILKLQCLLSRPKSR